MSCEAALAFGSFIEILQHVATQKGARVVSIECFYPSSKLCRLCGAINESLRLEDRYWRCECGKAHDRDVNAANNILDRALSSWGGEVRPASSALAA